VHARGVARKRERGGRGDRERLELDDHSLDRIRQTVRIISDHGGDGLPDVPHVLPREHGLAIRAQARGRDERGDRRRELRQILEGEHGEDPVKATRLGSINLADARVGVRAPDHTEVECPGEPEVIKIPSPSNDEAGVLFPLQRGANELLHDAQPRLMIDEIQFRTQSETGRRVLGGAL